MQPLALLRNKWFWMLDQLKGGSVRAHIEDIKFILENYASPEATQRRTEHLERILLHAVSTTAFYGKFKGYKINDFPVIDKNTIRNNFNEFLSSKYDRSKLHKVSTSGSTGTPFFVLQDPLKRFRQTADNLYFNEYAGFPLGNRLYYLRIWNEINRMGVIKRFIKNIVPIEASNLSEEATDRFLQQIKTDRSIKAFLAYSSTYEALLRNLLSLKITKIEGTVAVIFAMSEALPEPVRLQLSKIFNCPVLLRYSNSENGFLAHQYSASHNKYMINGASFLVEVLHIDKDEPVKDGEYGRIVITDLFNFAMPFIRYDTGDIGTLGYDQATGNPVFNRIEGRKLDFIYDMNGNMLSPHVIDYAIRSYEGVKQFQFIQIDHGNYKVKINTDNREIFNEVGAVEGLKNYVGKDAKIEVEYVHEIPLLASGKRKIVVNTMSDSQNFRAKIEG
jgi:phenylacetate-CoA ligase